MALHGFNVHAGAERHYHIRRGLGFDAVIGANQRGDQILHAKCCEHGFGGAAVIGCCNGDLDAKFVDVREEFLNIGKRPGKLHGVRYTPYPVHCQGSFCSLISQAMPRFQPSIRGAATWACR